MSAFLGFIHYWLYKKIRYVIAREELVYQKALAACGTTAEELRAQVEQTYGAPLPEGDLADVIAHDNIHGWLQRQINLAESREAAFIKELLAACPDTAEAAIAAAFVEQGRACAADAAAAGKYQTGGADGIYHALGDYYLNGMPCDQADLVLESSTTRVLWENKSWLQENNWTRTGVDARAMKAFYHQWLQGFVEGINADFTYRQIADTAQGASVNRYEIVRR